jgi:hypothetical protein
MTASLLQPNTVTPPRPNRVPRTQGTVRWFTLPVVRELPARAAQAGSAW